uniref:Putative mg-dependent dnase dna replication ovary overexpressed n=1 Tax=Rhipicephalus microplus TaxID=6941 RepID=A0A6M2D442_RHIMP
MTLQQSKMWPYNVASTTGLIDSHCHLDYLFSKAHHFGSYGDYRRANQLTFPDCYEGCVANFCNPVTFKLEYMWNALLSEDKVWGAFGVHPKMADEYNDQIEQQLLQALQHPSVVAFGEIGLDYSNKNRDEQQQVFRTQLLLATSRSLPLVIHSRNATRDTVRIMREMVPANYMIHVHCFKGNWKEARQWLDPFPHLCLGLTPNLEQSVELAEAARRIPLDRLLLETDAPFFLPKNERGKSNVAHPGMVIHVATQLANLRKVTIGEVLEAVRQNTTRVYGI